MAYLEEVFRLSGVPTITFVPPERYNEIKVSVRTPGRCLVVEGPSGIGKTTTITKVLTELGITAKATSLSARRPADVDYIDALPEMGDIGTVIVDDFHRLGDTTKSRLSDYMKLLADTSDENSKLILIGINKAGQQLVKFAHDLGLRIDVFKLEANPTELLEKVIILGESALNIEIPAKNEIANRARGSFQIVQLLCHKLCVLDDITETKDEKRRVDTSINAALEDVIFDLSRQFKDAAITFARGSRLRREGRAPYLHILRWLSESDEWSLDLKEAMTAYPEMRGSIGQVLDKGWLQALLTRISHAGRCIGALNRRKFFCDKGISRSRGVPRCRQSVARNGLNLERLRAASWLAVSTAERSLRMLARCCWVRPIGRFG